MVAPITAADLSSRLGVPLSNSDTRTVLDAAIADAQADVEAYLGRAVMPTAYTESGRWPAYGGWDLTPLDDPVRSITTIVAETTGVPPVPTGYYTVTYLAGLDCREPDKRPILRFITAAAMNAPEVTRLWQTVTGIKGALRSVSAEGQSVGYDTATLGGGGDPGSGRPGALPTLGSLDRWRIAGRRVYVRRGGDVGIWPHGDTWPATAVWGGW